MRRVASRGDHGPKSVVLPESITVKPDRVEVRVGETTTLDVKVLPDGADQSVSINGGDPSIAEVTQ